ncbi:MAG: T9SS type A sorting domain-containing protein [Sphingobacteriales bacterium]|nr:T9SS type A sorting domain-containing protein [Sphingobacteriales bacterium]
MLKLLFIAASLFLIVVKGRTQSVIPATANAGGGFYDNPASYVRYFEWSIGELTLINTVATADSSIVVYQGVLQPCTDKPGNSPLLADFQSDDFKLFPNPTLGRFEINFFVRETGILDLELTNAMGQPLQRRSFYYNGCCRIEHYDISQLPSGVYFIVATLRPENVSTINVGIVVRRSGLRVVKSR